MPKSEADAPSAEPFLPERRSLTALREAVQGCRGCDLYRDATQAVFGEGPAKAEAMFVGEQPGDSEDRQGRPFVGPAGHLFDRAMEEAGIDRAAVFLTNAVKHFKWAPRGKRRIHRSPVAEEIRACHPWLEAEIAAVKPMVLVALGAVGARALIGPGFKVTERRGQVVETSWPALVTATVHPSSILRAMDGKPRDEAYAALLRDLEFVRRLLRDGASAVSGS